MFWILDQNIKFTSEIQIAFYAIVVRVRFLKFRQISQGGKLVFPMAHANVIAMAICYMA